MTEHKSRKSSFKPEDLYIICSISNTVRHESRYHLYEQFEKHIRQHTDNLWTVEIAHGDRVHQITEKKNPQHIQLRSTMDSSVIWQKEPCWNLAVGRLPPEAKYLCFLDADIHFSNQDWIIDTLHALQHHKIIQPWTSVVNMTTTGRFIDTWNSIGYAVQNGIQVNSQADGTGYPAFFHPGFGIAMTKDTFSELGGFMTHAILGAADHHTFLALLGRVQESYPGNISQSYKDLCLEWQARCNTHIRGNVGCTPGLISHGFHGSFERRQYRSRWEILLKNEYDPKTDIKLDYQGLPQLTHTGHGKLYLDMLAYQRSRNEDHPSE